MQRLALARTGSLHHLPADLLIVEACAAHAASHLRVRLTRMVQPADATKQITTVQAAIDYIEEHLD